MLTAAPMPAAYDDCIRPAFYLQLYSISVDYHSNVGLLRSVGIKYVWTAYFDCIDSDPFRRIWISFAAIIRRTRTDADRAAHGLQPTTATRPAF